MTVRTDLRDRRADARQVRFYETLTVPKKTVQDAIEYLASTGFSISGLTSETPVMADSIPFSDVSDSNTNKKASFTQVQQLFDDQNWAWTGTHDFGAGVTFAATPTPLANDGAALGTGALSFSDLFLAAGGVINWANGGITITEATDVLSFAGATAYRFSAVVTPTTNDAAALGTGALAFSDLFLASGGVLNFNNGDVLLTHSANALAFSGASSGYNFDAAVLPSANDAAALGSATVSWADLFLASGGVVNFANGNLTMTHASGQMTVTGNWRYSGNAAPSANDGAALGSTTLMWSDLFLATGGVVNWNNGNVTITHAAAALAFAGASSGYTFSHIISPAANDGAPLGSTTLMWSDLFLASGGVINFNNGDVTLTHSADLLTLAGGNLSIGTSGVFTAGTIELGAASDTTLSRASAGIAAVEGIQLLKANGGQTITGGFTETSYNIGSVTGSNQTITPNPSNGGLQYATLNGSSLTGTLTFAAPSAGDVSMVVQVINGGSGAVGATLSTSGYTKVTGDAYATTNGNKYNFYITRLNSTYHLHIQALQ